MVSTTGWRRNQDPGRKKNALGSDAPEEGAELPMAHKALEGCCHYWVVGFPDGPSSDAKCMLCGEEREFSNYLKLSEDASSGKGKRRYLRTEGTGIRRQRGAHATALDRYDRSFASAFLKGIGVSSHG